MTHPAVEPGAAGSGAPRPTALERELQAIAEHAIDIVIRSNPDGTFAWVSPSVERVLGYRPAELIGRPVLSMVPPEEADLGASNRAQVYEGGGLSRSLVHVPTRDGVMKAFIAQAHVVHDVDGTVLGAVLGLHDVTELEAAREQLAAMQDALIDPLVMLTAERDANGRIVDLRGVQGNAALARYLGIDIARIPGGSFRELVPERYESPIFTMLCNVIERGTPVAIDDYPVDSLRDGSPIFLDLRAVRVGDGVVYTFRDATERHAQQEQLLRSEARFRLAMESAPTGMALVDLDRHFRQVNPALCRLLGRDEAWLLSHPLCDLLGPEQDTADLAARVELRTGTQGVTLPEQRIARPDGQDVWIDRIIGVLRNRAGEPVGYVEQFADITEAHEARRLLRFLADHDPMTGLHNRRAVIDEVAAILAHPVRSGQAMAMLFIDLDDFKPVNDRLGHAAGDALLTEVAHRIRRATRRGDLVARIGGDEFLVFLTALRDTADAGLTAHKLLEAISAPVLLGDDEVHVTASIGVCAATTGDATDTVLERADTAMYEAKRAGGNRVHMAHPAH